MLVHGCFIKWQYPARCYPILKIQQHCFTAISTMDNPPIWVWIAKVKGYIQDELICDQKLFLFTLKNIYYILFQIQTLTFVLIHPFLPTCHMVSSIMIQLCPAPCLPACPTWMSGGGPRCVNSFVPHHDHFNNVAILHNNEVLSASPERSIGW